MEVFETGDPEVHQVRFAEWHGNWINDGQLEYQNIIEYDKVGRTPEVHCG